MKPYKLKYFIFYLLLLIAFRARSQADNNADNGSTVIIMGNPLANDNSLGNLPPSNPNTNVISQTNVPPPPAQQQLAPIEENIEPTLENGFHMRYQIASPASVERLSTVGSSAYAGSGGSSYSGGVKAKHHASVSEMSFNFRKKFRAWFPKRKKKYHPTLCEKFK